jgi:hypothetical protein
MLTSLSLGPCRESVYVDSLSRILGKPMLLVLQKKLYDEALLHSRMPFAPCLRMCAFQWENRGSCHVRTMPCKVLFKGCVKDDIADEESLQAFECRGLSTFCDVCMYWLMGRASLDYEMKYLLVGDFS